MNNYTLLGVISLILISTSFNTNAVSISTFRLFLDPTKRFTELTVHNPDLEEQTCSVKLVDLTLTADGLGKDNSAEQLPSPRRFVRFAPSQFELGPKQSQAFKAIYRRVPNTQNGEYIGAAAIKCKKKYINSTELAVVTPSLVHNVPLVVRTGKLNTEFSFLKAEKIANTVEVDLKVTGMRSVTGDLFIVNKSSGETVAKKKRVSVYAQWDKQTISVALPEGFTGKELLLRFVEDPESGAIAEEFSIQ